MDGIYFDEKKARKRRLIFKLAIYGGLTIFFALLIGAAYLVIYSPLFQIKEINIRTSDVPDINGNNFRTADVQKLTEDLKFYFAARTKLASILGPENILIWDQDKLDGFLKNEPQIAELTIEKDYIERRVEIQARKRERFGVWCQLTNNQQPTTNRCYWLDKSGVIFAEAPMVEGALINKVNDFTGRQLIIGEKILEQKFLDNLLKIFVVLEKSELGKGFLKLENLGLQEIVFDSPAGFKIYFSLRIDPDFALAGIKSLKETGLEKMDYIDFRVENRMYYKTK